MTITYTKTNDLIKKNGFEFIFSFEHGDADSNETYNLFHEGMTEVQFLEYVKKSEEISKMIEISHSTGVGLDSNFETNNESNGFYIPVELDLYAKMHMSGYYASSGISEMFYYNQEGEKFKVHVS